MVLRRRASPFVHALRVSVMLAWELMHLALSSLQLPLKFVHLQMHMPHLRPFETLYRSNGNEARPEVYVMTKPSVQLCTHDDE